MIKYSIYHTGCCEKMLSLSYLMNLYNSHSVCARVCVMCACVRDGIADSLSNWGQNLGFRFYFTAVVDDLGLNWIIWLLENLTFV